jgi:poly(3-hydroxybutyrate) depolymerase
MRRQALLHLGAPVLVALGIVAAGCSDPGTRGAAPDAERAASSDDVFVEQFAGWGGKSDSDDDWAEYVQADFGWWHGQGIDFGGYGGGSNAFGPGGYGGASNSTGGYGGYDGSGSGGYGGGGGYDGVGNSGGGANNGGGAHHGGYAGAASLPTDKGGGQGNEWTSFTVNGGFKCDVYVPQGASGPLPVMLYLHGSGDFAQTSNPAGKKDPLSGGLPKALGAPDQESIQAGCPRPSCLEKKKFPFMVVVPHGEGSGHDKDGWNRFCDPGTSCSGTKNLGGAKACLDQAMASNNGDASRVYVTGLSKGGIGAFSLAAAFPGTFAAILSLSGGADPKIASHIGHVPMRLHHHKKDGTNGNKGVPYAWSCNFAAAAKQAGAQSVKMVANNDPITPHSDQFWSQIYCDSSEFDWLLSNSKGNPAPSETNHECDEPIPYPNPDKLPPVSRTIAWK